ncbi:hypothetical protein [Deinococcus aestuarii]|uniref:hypothetical protein n=1 Tax=Deinococcus aestuarii TaxID=2774531 RepID=UPI001C0B3F12|nr:hypothetical protein [Deinococcus aestuarii]
MTPPDRLEAVRRLHGRVARLGLRIEKTPQPTPQIRQRARAIAAPLRGAQPETHGAFQLRPT